MSDRKLQIALWLVFAAFIARAWLMPLPSSFWVDEMGSVFVVHHGAGDPTLRDAPQVADSIYYVLPKIAEKVGGLSEVTYRLFSVMAMGAALWAIAQLASLLIDTRAAWFVVFACLASRSFNFQAGDARPYALGTMTMSFAVLWLVRWLNEGKWLHAVLFAICAGAMWWIHLVFWPLYVVFLIYGGYRLITGQHKASRSQVLAVSLVVAAACVPVALRAIALLHGASAHVVAEPPSLSDLLRELKLSLITSACAVAALLARWRDWTAGAQQFSKAAFVLVMAWWLVDPVVIFAFSHITGNSLWVPRYLYLALPGVALAATALTGLFLPSRLWRKAALYLACGVLLFSGQWGRVWPQHQRSNWKVASSELNSWVAGADVPVICPSPFVEAQSPTWTPDYPVSGFLYSHLTVYPMQGHVYPFPFEPSEAAAEFGRQLTTGALARAGRFAVYGGDHNVNYWSEWFAAQPELRSWKTRVLGLHGDVKIVTFSR